MRAREKASAANVCAWWRGQSRSLALQVRLKACEAGADVVRTAYSDRGGIVSKHMHRPNSAVVVMSPLVLGATRLEKLSAI